MGAHEVASIPVMTSGKYRVDGAILLRFKPWSIKGRAPRSVTEKSDRIHATNWPLFQGIARLIGESFIPYLASVPFQAAVNRSFR